jgi:cytochrome P450 family 6
VYVVPSVVGIVIATKRCAFSVPETLRKYPPLVTLNRVVTKPYVLPGTAVKLKTGTKIVIPVHAIHYDPKYYADPEAFEPDRFSDENVHNLHPNTYMPFGDGPRFCIGTDLVVATINRSFGQ